MYARRRPNKPSPKPWSERCGWVIVWNAAGIGRTWLKQPKFKNYIEQKNCSWTDSPKPWSSGGLTEIYHNTHTPGRSRPPAWTCTLAPRFRVPRESHGYLVQWMCRPSMTWVRVGFQFSWWPPGVTIMRIIYGTKFKLRLCNWTYPFRVGGWFSHPLSTGSEDADVDFIR